MGFRCRFLTMSLAIGGFGQPSFAADAASESLVAVRATARIHQGLRINAQAIEELQRSRVEMQVSKRIVDQEMDNVTSVPTAGQTLLLIELF